MEESMTIKNKDPCLCRCHFPRPYYFPMNCCCSCIYLLHESSPNLNSKFYHLNESQPFLIPKKEKELFLKSQKCLKKKDPEISNNIIKNSNPQNKKIKNHFPSKTNNIKLDLVFDEDVNNIIKSNNENKIVNNTINKIIEDDKNKINKYKRIEVNKAKQDRSTTCPASDKSKRKKRIIDMNNCIPFIPNRKDKAKYINNYEINKNSNKKKTEIFINRNAFENMKFNNNYNKKFNSTRHSDEKRFNFNTVLKSKLKMGDLSDDILDFKQNYSTMDNTENKLILENLRNEIDKAKQIIHILKVENEKLKMKLYFKEQNINNNKQKKVNKSTNTSPYIEIDNEKEKRSIIQKELFEREVKILKNEISEITFKLNEYENFISILKKSNNDLEKIIKNKDREIMELMTRLENTENENKNRLNELNIRSIEMLKEKENLSSDYKLNNDNLKQEIIKLQELLNNKNNRIKELEIKIKYEKNFDSKKQKLLELLFDFYMKIKKIINYDKSNESFRNILEIFTVDEFEIKLNKVVKKLKQIIDDIQIKYGHCFACDIACCTSHVDKLKSFRKNNTKK